MIFPIKYFNLDKQIDIVFLHGWGSNKEIMQQSFSANSYLKNYRLIFVDLPGFGQSSNDFVLDSKRLCKNTRKFFLENNIKKDIIVGHSFGGKIACLLNPSKMVLLSSAGIIVKKSFYVIVRIYLFKVLKFLGLSFTYKFFASKDVKSMSKNMYGTFKKVVNEDFKEIFSNYRNETMIFWGKKDKQTPLKSGLKISSLILNSKINILEGNHFFFIDKYNSNIICRAINILSKNL